MKNGHLQTMPYKSLSKIFISMEERTVLNTQRNRFHIVKPPDTITSFSDKNTHNRDKFCQSGYYSRKAGPVSIISFLGSDQQGHLDQHFVPNWPLANIE